MNKSWPETAPLRKLLCCQKKPSIESCCVAENSTDWNYCIAKNGSKLEMLKVPNGKQLWGRMWLPGQLGHLPAERTGLLQGSDHTGRFVPCKICGNNSSAFVNGKIHSVWLSTIDTMCTYSWINSFWLMSLVIFWEFSAFLFTVYFAWDWHNGDF